MLKKIFFFIALTILSTAIINAQVTTSGITGTVKGADGNGLTGATVKAVHTPSGSEYATATSSSGVFSLQGLRTGGPYTVEISYVGLSTKTLNDIYLVLGESFVINETLGQDAQQLEGVVVTATGGSRLDRNKTGASTNISTQQINSLPTITRSITDFTRLTPQSNGNSFAGRDGRYNNVQIDGANFNNGFGLSDAPLPGGGGLSIDAIEEIQVNIAPYDVRQGGFTGAGINAVTRSGTNKFQGSIYHFFRNEGLLGRKVNGDAISGLQESSTKTWGARLGGPIIKNKLFFFVNYEKIDAEGAGAGATNLWRASEDGKSNVDQNITRVKRSDLEAVRDHLINQWGYNPGAYEGYANKSASSTESILARLDWNISTKHKLAVRYNRTENSRPVLVNGNSGAYPRAPNGYYRTGENAMSFANTMYGEGAEVNSYTLELNSRFSNKVSNQFLATYSKINSGRTSPSAEFPFIDIGTSADNNTRTSGFNNYISAGYELFTYNNQVLNDNINIFNNVTITTGKHNILAGASFELQKFANNYMRNGTSYYRYASVEDFLKTGTPAEVAPLTFALTYPYEGQDPWSKVNYALPSVYLQDNITVTDRFNLTVGLRAEMPMFLNDLAANTNTDALEFLGLDGSPKKYNSGAWPKNSITLSPRVGFRYDAMGDRSLIVRGGTGIFAGRVPFVWLTNMPSTTGMIQNQVEPGSYADVAGWINGIRFNPDKMYWANNPPPGAENVFIKTSAAGVPGTLALVNDEFKMPQVFRSNLGIDKKIGNSPFTASVDLMYTKDLQSVYNFGINRKPATQKMYDGRDYYPTANDTRYNSAMGGNSAMALSNTTKGHAFNITAGVNMAARRGVFGSLFYSHTMAKNTSDNNFSSATSAWGAVPQVNGPNDLILASAVDALPHRVVGSLSYRIEYLKHLATTVSLFYNGASQGRYSFVYSNDVNGDAVNNDLLYIPKSGADINFVAITGDNPFTVEEQRAAFDKLMSNSKYLDENRGKMAERNGALMPWYHRFDLKLLQDVFANIGKNRNTLQLSFDIQNFGNFLNSNWGVMQQRINNAATPLQVVTKGENPTFRMNTATIDGAVVLPTEMYQDQRTFGTTWTMQIGIRYLFN